MNWVSAFPLGYSPDKPGEYGPTFDRITLAWCNLNVNNTHHAGAIVDLMAQFGAHVVWRGAVVRAVVQRCKNNGGEPKDDDYLIAGCEVLISSHPDKQTALRVAVVSAVITLLETPDAL